MGTFLLRGERNFNTTKVGPEDTPCGVRDPREIQGNFEDRRKQTICDQQNHFGKRDAEKRKKGPGWDPVMSSVVRSPA